MSQQTNEAKAIVRQIEPLLAGKPRLMQSAILADLLATWLAGHFCSSPSETEELRKQILDQHLDLVRQLLPFNEREIEAKMKAGLKGFGINDIQLF
jgi:hypothetical protein